MATIEERLHELRQCKERYAKAQAQRVYLDHFRKSKLAILTAQALKDGATSVAQAEVEARSHKEYLDVLEGLRDATEIAEKEYWELRIAEMGAKLWQTKQANERIERQSYT